MEIKATGLDLILLWLRWSLLLHLSSCFYGGDVSPLRSPTFSRTCSPPLSWIINPYFTTHSFLALEKHPYQNPSFKKMPAIAPVILIPLQPNFLEELSTHTVFSSFWHLIHPSPPSSNLVSYRSTKICSWNSLMTSMLFKLIYMSLSSSSLILILILDLAASFSTSTPFSQHTFFSWFSYLYLCFLLYWPLFLCIFFGVLLSTCLLDIRVVEMSIF